MTTASTAATTPRPPSLRHGRRKKMDGVSGGNAAGPALGASNCAGAQQGGAAGSAGPRACCGRLRGVVVWARERASGALGPQPSRPPVRSGTSEKESRHDKRNNSVYWSLYAPTSISPECRCRRVAGRNRRLGCSLESVQVRGRPRGPASASSDRPAAKCLSEEVSVQPNADHKSCRACWDSLHGLQGPKPREDPASSWAHANRY